MCTNRSSEAMRYAKPDVQCPEKLIVGVSRFYVFHLTSGSPTLEQIETEVDGYGVGWLLCPLMTFWDLVLASTTEKIDLHQPDYPARSAHEQALLLALHALSHADPWAAHASLQSIVPTTTVRLLIPELRKIVGRLADRQPVEPIAQSARLGHAPMPYADPEPRLLH